jgi:hypothetical protein
MTHATAKDRITILVVPLSAGECLSVPSRVRPTYVEDSTRLDQKLTETEGLTTDLGAGIPASKCPKYNA